MTFAAPLWLLALPALAAAAWLLRRGGALAATLPGQWDLIVDPPLRGPIARGLPDAARGPRGLILAAATLTALALAKPVMDAGAPLSAAGLAGRVVVVEVVRGVDPGPQRRLAARLLEAGGPSTALVAAAGEGYDVVPLTTDRRHLSRYLAVLGDEVMPEHGRRPASGLAHAEATLARAGVIVGQTVFLPAAAPPVDPGAAPPPRGLRAVLVEEELHGAWAGLAEDWGARLVGPGEIPALAAELDAAVAREIRSRVPDGATDLRPWLAALAAACWLGLFRRRTDA